jgi:hypothetical protein
VVGLQQILCIPHVPPDVRVVQVAPVKRENELNANKDKR